MENEKNKSTTTESSKKPDEEVAVQATPPDGGLRAWLVCILSCWTNGALFGLINNAGVTYVELEKVYVNTDSFRLSLVGSLCIGSTFLLSPVAAILTDRFGIQKISFAGSILVLLGITLSSFATSLDWLYLTYGILFGVGASLAYTPSLVILGHYFKRRLSLVNGIVAAGSSISTMVLPYILEYLFVHFGLSNTYRILVIIMVPLLTAIFIFVPVFKKEINEESRSKQEESCFDTEVLGCSIWKNKKYLVWAISFPVCLFGYFVPYVHLVKHTNDILPGYDAKVLMLCIGGASFIGRLTFGVVADIPGINRILLQQISFFSIGVLTMLISVANSYWILIVICLGMGIFDGCFITLLGPIAFDIVGTKKASQAIGFLLGLCSVPLTLGPPIAGWMYDHMGKSYQLAFVAAGIPPVIGALLMFCIRLVKTDISPPPDTESKELEHMLKNSETKESKINDDDNEDGGVWKRNSLKKNAHEPAVKLLGVKSQSEDEDNCQQVVEKLSTC